MVASLPIINKSNGASTRNYSSTGNVASVPNLIQNQLDSFEWFKTDGLTELFQEISPIDDSPGNWFELSFLSHRFEEPERTEDQCRSDETTF